MMRHLNILLSKSGLAGSLFRKLKLGKKSQSNAAIEVALVSRHPSSLRLVVSGSSNAAALEAPKHSNLPSSMPDLVQAERVLFRIQMILMSALLGTLTLAIGYWELTTSGIEAHMATWLAPRLSYETTSASGLSPDFRAPAPSPYDTMLGYSMIPEWTRSLCQKNFVVQSQAGLSPVHSFLVDLGLPPIYQEKTVHGLKLYNKDQGTLYNELYPRLRYSSYKQIPALVRDTLLFIEDRQILDEKKAQSLNPAISWERLMRAVVEFVLDKTVGDRNVPGGSTLATQIEKFRHSPEGRTHRPTDKLKQIISASLRSYLLGKDTTGARQQIILNYINEVPLGAAYGFGEVRGLGEAMQVWFQQDLMDLNQILKADSSTLTPEDLEKQAKAYKQILAMFLSQRRPSYYLLSNPNDLDQLARSYLRLMKGQGLIHPQLADLAIDQPLNLIPFTKSRMSAMARNSVALNGQKKGYTTNKAAYAARVELQQLLGVRTLYQLDRIDADIQTTFSPRLQEQISAKLKYFQTEDGAKKAGMIGERMLQPSQASAVHYSFNLVETTDAFNAVRVQTDTIDGPLDLNRGGKLELGSTAKLRTLVTYLEMMADTFNREVEQLNAASDLDLALKAPAPDELTQFVRSYLLSRMLQHKAAGKVSPPQPDQLGTLTELLEMAIKREFSASPYQSFWTGGGRMTFNNFDEEENSLSLSVLEAFQKSNNLVFVRVMKDMVQHVIHSRIEHADVMLKDPNHPLRKKYLEDFIELESKMFLRRFYRDLKGKTSDERLTSFTEGKHLTSSRLAALTLTLRPDYDFMAFRLTLKNRLPSLEETHILSLYQSMQTHIMNLADRAYLARTHPLALWTALYLDVYPKASWSDILFDSRHVRYESYEWLRSKAGHGRQERDILTMLEREAFRKHIFPYWKRQGFPFNSMIPTLASALGSSGDRPAALADLMGAIHNEGMVLPTRRIESITLGRSTPFETRFTHGSEGGQRAMRVEVAAAALIAVREVVHGGTARRLRGTVHKANGQEVMIAAKTGTGDNRIEVHNAHGGLIRSEAKSRTATLIFGIGDRFYGTITAYVAGQSSGAKIDDFKFTSSLVVQCLKALLPDLANDILREEDPEGVIFRQADTH